jgi:hypothetical protein
MNKQFIVSVIVMFILSMALGFAVHGALLKNDYLGIPNLMRNEADSMRHFPAMILAHVFLAIGVTAIYRRGREAGKSWSGQGFRFGILLIVFSTLPVYLIYYAVQPMPLNLVEKQIAFDSVASIILGLAVAALNKPAEAK